MANVPSLPIIKVDNPHPRGFAGLISDTSLLDVETIVADSSNSTKLFRAGTVAKIVGVNATTGTRKATFAVAGDAKGADSTVRFVAVSFSHDTCDQEGEIYIRNPDYSGVVNVKPANGVNIGRIWLFLNGATPSATGVAAVAIANVPSAATPFDKTKPYVNGAVKVATVTSSTSDAIPGWKFTGVTEIDPATGYQIAEVEINRAW